MRPYQLLLVFVAVLAVSPLVVGFAVARVVDLPPVVYVAFAIARFVDLPPVPIEVGTAVLDALIYWAHESLTV